MKELFKSLNNVTIDCDDYDAGELTELEKRQMKKRIARKLKNNKPGIARRVGVAVAILALLSFGFAGVAQNPSVLANIPLIGAALEEYIDSSKPDLEDYKVVIGQTVEDKGIEIRLNEVLLDNGRLVVSSTFSSAIVDCERLSATPTVYINGKKVLIGSTGSAQRIDDTTVITYTSVDLEDIKIDEVLNIKISYNDMIYTDTGKRVKGNWEPFEFTATGKKLMAETRTIVINKQLAFPDGQEITVTDMVISPFSTMLNYSCTGGKEYISFEIEDQDGYRQKPNRARTLSTNSYNRFDQKSLADATRVTVTPMSLILKTGTFETYPDKAFEVILNNSVTKNIEAYPDKILIDQTPKIGGRKTYQLPE